MHCITFGINVNTTVKCNTHKYLNEADFNYIKDRILHTRFEEGTHGNGVSLKYSRLFESGKTIMQAAEYLQDIFAYNDASLKLDPNKMVAEGNFKIGKITTNDKKSSRHSLHLKLAYGELASDENITTYGYTVTVECGSHRNIIFRKSYPLNEAEIMSYDMNFPAPILFVNEVYAELHTNGILS